METLIELYDERPLENVLATEVFHPRRTVFICPERISRDTGLKRKLKEYFARRGVDSDIVFTPARMFDAADVLKKLRRVCGDYSDCALDITGGSDDALFAAGFLAREINLPVFTYSRRKNRFFNIMNAEYVERIPVKLSYSVEEAFLMAGGSLRKGRVDNSILNAYMDRVDPFFNIYMSNRRDWTRICEYIQQLSNGEGRGLEAWGDYTQRLGRNYLMKAPEAVLKEYEELGLIRKLVINTGKDISFRFSDETVRFWLRDIGSVLELYTYKQCLEAGCFDSVMTSAVVDWEGDNAADDVTNEIDVVATRGVNQIFISCKTCEVKTEALNELAILRARFGSGMSAAAIITTKPGGAPMRRRAAELAIDVIDSSDILAGKVAERLKHPYMIEI